jgi:hypothetical protein
VKALDTFWFGDTLAEPAEHPGLTIHRTDIRAMDLDLLAGVNVVIALAAISNDSAGQSATRPLATSAMHSTALPSTLLGPLARAASRGHEACTRPRCAGADHRREPVSPNPFEGAIR